MPTEPLQELLYHTLTKQIFSGRFQSGVIYSETKLAAELQVSRTPLKNALTRLAHDKYIDILPSKGFQLHIMTADDIQNTCQIRTAIEGFCSLELMHRRESPEAVSVFTSLEDILNDMERACAEHKTPAFSALDTRFHREILSFPHNQELSELMDAYNYRQNDFAWRTLNLPGRMQQALAEHRAIFQEIRSGTMQSVYAAVQRHMDTTQTLAMQLLAQQA